LIIYQHVRGVPVARRVNKVMNTVEDVIGTFSACSYESGTVAMLFLSRARGRVSQVAANFKVMLGRHAAGRVRRFEFRR
jgi:hypothetical protein